MSEKKNFVFREEEAETYKVSDHVQRQQKIKTNLKSIQVSKGAHLKGMSAYESAYKESIEHNAKFWEKVKKKKKKRKKEKEEMNVERPKKKKIEFISLVFFIFLKNKTKFFLLFIKRKF